MEVIANVHGKKGVLPICMDEGSVGYDIALPEGNGNLLMPYNSRRAVDTGIILKPPTKCFTLLVPRSSSRKKGIRISNTLGIIDPSYSGRDDTLIVDLTRDPKKIEFIGRIKYDDIEKRPNLKMSRCAELQFLEENPEYSYEHGRLSQQYDIADCSYHFFWDPPIQLVTYKVGERFCQIIFIPFEKPKLLEQKLKEFGMDSRGGFGSTGKK